MNEAPSPPGWYTAPDNPVMVRFWDGEIWTDSIRPAPNSSVGAGGALLRDHHVQNAPAIDALLEDGETIEAGYRGGTGSGRKVFAVATDRRLIVAYMSMIRTSRVKRFVALSYDEIDTIGVNHTELIGTEVIVTSGEHKLRVGHSHNHPAFIAHVQSRMDDDDTEIDLSALPAPGSVGAAPMASNGAVSSSAPATGSTGPSPKSAPSPIGVADEIRKLADLKAEGLLTAAEFEAQKQRLLDL